MEERMGTIAWAFCYWWLGKLQRCVQCTQANNSSERGPIGAMAVGCRSWFLRAGSCTAACRATARSLVSNFSDTTKCHLNLLLLRLQTFCWWYFSSELKRILFSWGFPCMYTWSGYFLVMWHSEFPRRHPRDLLTQLYLPIPCTTAPYMQEHHINKLSNSCIMDLLPHSQNVQSQKRAHTLSHLVCNWRPLFGTVDFSQTFQHSLVLCVNSWGTIEEAALMGEKAWKVSNWQNRVVDFPIIVLT